MSRLVVLSGPSAVGKGTIVSRLRELYPDVWVSVSTTTRQPRTGEIDGVHYDFVSDAEFDHLVDTDQMLEWATVHGENRYGTPRGPVEARLANGGPCILEIDPQGALQVRESMPEALLVFVEPPSWDELERRLVGRGTEDEEQRQRRLETARHEMDQRPLFDVVIVNDDLDACVRHLNSIMRDAR